MFKQPLNSGDTLFGFSISGSRSDLRQELSVKDHRISGLRCAATLTTPAGAELVAVGTTGEIAVALKQKTIACIKLKKGLHLRDVQLFTLSKFSGIEVWLGALLGNSGGRAYEAFSRIGKDGALAPIKPSACYSKHVYDSACGLHTNEHATSRSYQPSSSDSAVKRFFYVGGAESEGGGVLWRGRVGSGSCTEVDRWSQEISVCTLTSSPARIAIGFRNGDLSIHRIIGQGELAPQVEGRVNLHRLGFEKGSIATALEFLSYDNERPTQRDALLIGTNRSEIGVVDIGSSLLVALDQGSSRNDERIRCLHVDSQSLIHAYFGDK